jgi:hypothetical protein
MTEHEKHPDPNPVRPSQAEGDADERKDSVLQPDTSSEDPRTNRPSQAEGEDPQRPQ